MNDVSMAGAGNIERHEIENQRRGFWSAINALASLPIRSVQVMPDLARPVADPRDLPENATSWVSSSTAMWIWAWNSMKEKNMAILTLQQITVMLTKMTLKQITEAAAKIMEARWSAV